MIKLIKAPSIIKAAGTKGKIIEEFFGRVNSKTFDTSIARMGRELQSCILRGRVAECYFW